MPVDREIQKRNRGNKRRGASFELDLLKYLRSKGYDTIRQSRTGKRDEGDVSIMTAWGAVVIEAKNVQRMDLPSFLRQAAIEAEHFKANRGWTNKDVEGIVVVKRRGASIGESYVVVTLDQYLSTL